MTVEKIKERLEQAKKNLNNDDLEIIFPSILDDLYYLLYSYNIDYNQLTRGEQFEDGYEFGCQIIDYLGLLARKYLKIIYQLDLEIVNEEEYNMAVCAGGYDKKTDKMYYSYFGSTLSYNGQLGFLFTCLHEARHKMQNDLRNNLDGALIDPRMILLTKEEILENSLKENNRQFYKDNYSEIFYENDAESFAKAEISVFLNNIFTQYTKLMQSRGKEVSNEIIDKKNSINVLIKLEISQMKSPFTNEEIIGQLNGEIPITGNYQINAEEKDKLIVMDKYLKAHPEMKEKYPLLQILFQGNRVKTYEELMYDKEQLLLQGNVQNVDRLFYYIIETDPILALKKRLTNGSIDDVKQYLSLHPTLFEEYSDEISVLEEQNPELQSCLKERRKKI